MPRTCPEDGASREPHGRPADTVAFLCIAIARGASVFAHEVRKGTHRYGDK